MTGKQRVPLQAPFPVHVLTLLHMSHPGSDGLTQRALENCDFCPQTFVGLQCGPGPSLSQDCAHEGQGEGQVHWEGAWHVLRGPWPPQCLSECPSLFL